MSISEIKLRGFRNISETHLLPENGINFIIGKNGQGKTSILEAIHFLSSLRSFKGSKNEEVLKKKCDWSELSCSLLEDQWNTEIKVTFLKKNDFKKGERVLKTAFIGGKAYRSSALFLSTRYGQKELGFHSIVFNPSDHDLIRGEPSLRRQYIDRTIAAENLDYLKLRTRYQKILDQRNALLKQSWFNSFDEELINTGSQITLIRLRWILKLKDELKKMVEKINPFHTDLSVFYSSQWLTSIYGISIENQKLNADLNTLHFTGQFQLPSLDFIKDCFRNKLRLSASAEIQSGNTLVGPHRDDWGMVFSDRFLRGHGSQGETRIALIALKLSEINLFREATGFKPVLLLDDFSSELDQERRKFLLDYLSNTDLQVFVTSTEEPSFKNEAKIFRVQNGQMI